MPDLHCQLRDDKVITYETHKSRRNAAAGMGLWLFGYAGCSSFLDRLHFNVASPAHGGELHFGRKLRRVLVAVHLGVEFFDPVHAQPDGCLEIGIVVRLALEHQKLARGKVDHVKPIGYFSRVGCGDFHPVGVNTRTLGAHGFRKP